MNRQQKLESAGGFLSRRDGRGIHYRDASSLGLHPHSIDLETYAESMPNINQQAFTADTRGESAVLIHRRPIQEQLNSCEIARASFENS